MFEFLKRFFRREESEDAPRPRNTAPATRPPTVRPRPAPPTTNRGEPDVVDPDAGEETHIETVGPGKNVLIRNRYVREETGTYETLKIVDDSLVDSGEETGIDPYNTGDFDRSRNWDRRFRK